MLLKVIRADGTLGTAKATDIGKLAKSGKIAAYQYSGWWIELRRKRNSPFNQQERRVHVLY